MHNPRIQNCVMRSIYFKGVPHKFKDRLVQHEEIKVVINVGKKNT